MMNRVSEVSILFLLVIVNPSSASIAFACKRKVEVDFTGKTYDKDVVTCFNTLLPCGEIALTYTLPNNEFFIENYYCLKKTTKPTKAKVCLDITVRDGRTSDWFTLCVTFNQPPVFGQAVQPAVINLEMTPPPVDLTIPVNTGPDGIQSFSLTGVDPSSFTSNFQSTGGTTKITLTGTPEVRNVTDVYLNVSITDDGQPPLSVDKVFHLVLLRDKVTCDDMGITYVDVEKETRFQMDCNSLADNSINYSVENSGNPFNVSVSSNGTVTVTAASSATLGVYHIVVTASTILGVEKAINIALDLGRVPVCDKTVDVLVLSRQGNVNLSPQITCRSERDSKGVPSTGIQTEEQQAAFDLIAERNATALTVTIQIVEKTFLGPNQLVIEVSNSYGTTLLTFELAHPPLLTSPQTQFSLLESVPADTVITTFSVDDPDPTPGTLSVFDTADPTADIPFAMKVFDLSVTETLNASAVTEYLLSVKVIDSTNLTDAVNITIQVNDTNDAPWCDYDNGTLSLSIWETRATGLVTQLACFDSDVVEEFKQLSYSLTPKSDQQYDHFNFSRHSNELMMVTSLKNVELPESGVIHLQVKISDSGQPPLFTLLDIDITVVDSRPTCKNSEITLEIKEMESVGACFNVTHQCRDPTAKGLSFSFASTMDYLEIEPVTKNSPSVTFCIKKSVYGIPGSYESQITVANTNGSVVINMVLNVTDVNEAPTFVNLPDDGMFTVMEDASIGTSIDTVTVKDVDSKTESNGQYTLLVTVVGEEISGIAFDRDVQKFLVQAKLNAKYNSTYNTVYRFTVRAVDGGGLSADTPIGIKVIDVNEPPVCSPDTITVPVISELGVLTDINCTDPDIQDNYTAITYKVQPPYTEQFNINDEGKLTLVKLLPLDQDQHVINITAYNDVDKTLSTSFSILLNINRTFPPSCDMTEAQTKFKDTDSTGVCSTTKVTCTSPVRGGLDIQVSGNLPDSVQVQMKNLTTGIEIRLCVQTALRDSIGVFQANISVENLVQQYAFLSWNVTVVDENEPPAFQMATYEVTVDETLPKGSSIVSVDIGTGITFDDFNGKVIQVKDPDKYTDGYQIKSIDAEPYALSRSDLSLVQLADFPISYSQSTFSVTGVLDESLIYKFNITVVDGEGLSAKATLNVKVNDVNEAPTCSESVVTLNKTLLVTEDKVVTRLTCTDPDYEKSYKITKYKLDGQDKGQFAVSSRGVVVVAGQLPRDRDRLAFAAVAVDGADPSLTFSVSITISVKRDIAATCLVKRYPPDTWVYNSCYNITLGCTDPTTGDDSTLKYKFSGNYTTGFQLTQKDGNVVLCYTKTQSGTYTLDIEVDNGLLTTDLKEVIEVQYERSTPKFEKLSVKETVVYDVGVGSALFKVTAVTTGIFAGNIVYSLLDESTPDTAISVFTVSQQTGTVSSLKPLRPYIGKKFILKIEALDERSRLKATASVEVTVDETNLKPVCPKNTDKDTISVSMTEAVGKVIATVNCTDPNIQSKHNTLTYRTTGTPNKYFAVESETGEVSIAEPLPFKDIHVLFIEASDGHLTDRTTLVIKVEIKLKPTITVMKITTSSVKIKWTFSRADYPQYVVKYVIKWETDTTTSQKVIDKGESEYLFNNLKPGVVYFITLTTVTQDFNTTQPVTVTTKEIPLLASIAVELKITNQIWSAALLDQESQEYKKFKLIIESNIKEVLKNLKGTHNVKVINMREGSVLVDSVISVNQSGNVNATFNTMEKAIASGQIESTEVDPKFSAVYFGDKYVVILALEVAQRKPNEITEGLTVSASCKARLVGQGTQPLFRWRLKGFHIDADQSTRLNVTQSQHSKDRFGFTSVITFRPIKATDTGSLECIVTDSTEVVKTASKSIQLDVIAKPRVTLVPMTLYLKPGQADTLTCTVNSEKDVTITWSINNKTVDNIGATRDGKTEVLKVTDINAEASYKCHAKNIAGIADSNVAIVGPLKEELFCNDVTDDHGIVWPKIPAGKTAESKCVGHYRGHAVRSCLSTGKWKDTADLTNCRLQTLIELSNKAVAKKEGIDSGSTEAMARSLENLTSVETLVSGDLDISIKIMEDILYVNEKCPNKIIKTEEIKDLVKAADNILNTPKQQWEDIHGKRKRGASALMKSLDSIGRMASGRAEDMGNSSQKTQHVHVFQNLVLEYGKSNANNIEFPQPQYYKYPTWMKESKTKAFLHSTAYTQALQGETFMGYSGLCYKDMSEIMPAAELSSGKKGSKMDSVNKMVNSLVISFTLNPRPVGLLDPPMVLTFEHISDNFSDPSCGFLDYSPPYETSGRWSTEGCIASPKSANVTVCKCNHFTNFALLMSPGKTPLKDVLSLKIISIVGCAISIFCLVLTVGTYIVLWRYVKTEKPDRVIVLLTLCVVLILAYLLFLLGVTRTENKDVCTTISVLLHYFYLVVFFLMLAEGIELFVCVVYVFNSKSRIGRLMLMSWGVPAIIVAISLGVTQLKGYGNENFCWLSLDSGLLWAFVGPALTVILINFIIIIVVLKTMFSTTAMMTKDAKEKGKAGVKALFVLLPVMGLTWVFGVFSVNEDTIVFEYLFAIFNSLQGLFIFIFHCLLSRQVQDGMRNRKRRYRTPSHDTKTTYSQHNTSHRKTSDDTSGSSELEKKISPFLEADRQVQQIAEKLSKVEEKENFLDKQEENKAAGTLDNVNVPAEVPEVKEMNKQVQKPDTGYRPSLQPAYQQPQQGYGSPRKPPLTRLAHRPLQHNASIEENMLQQPPLMQPYRKTSDRQEDPKYSMPAPLSRKSVDHQEGVKSREDEEGMIHVGRKHSGEYYNYKQSKREKPQPAGIGHRMTGNSDSSLHDIKYKGCDLPLYIGQADDRWRNVRQAVEMRQFSNHTAVNQGFQHQSEEDLSRYNYYQPITGVHPPTRRLPRTRFSDDEIYKPMNDYHW